MSILDTNFAPEDYTQVEEIDIKLENINQKKNATKGTFHRMSIDW